MKNNVIVTLLFCFHSFVNAQDVSNSKDHELLTRYPGTEIKNYYDEHTMKHGLLSLQGAMKKVLKNG